MQKFIYNKILECLELTWEIIKRLLGLSKKKVYENGSEESMEERIKRRRHKKRTGG